MDGWVDIHGHALPGVDDGAADIETSLVMLRNAAEEGLQQVVLTPHRQANHEPDQLRLHEQVFAELVSAVAGAGLPINLHRREDGGFVLLYSGLPWIRQRVWLVDLMCWSIYRQDLVRGPRAGLLCFAHSGMTADSGTPGTAWRSGTQSGEDPTLV